MKNKLNVQSIFDSIDGEYNGFNGAGELCTFIRLKGCNLRCQWCLVGSSQIRVIDSHHKISLMRIKDIKVGQKVLSYDFVKNVLVESKVLKKYVHSVKKENILKIEFEVGSPLYVTKEHLFYMNREWIRADRLKVGDELCSINQIWINKFSAKYRDNSYQKGQNKGIIRSQSTIEKLRKVAKEREENLSSEQRKERAKKGWITRSKWGRVTDCEKYFIELFKDLPVKFVGNGKVWIGGKNPDFVVGGQKKVIEVSDSTAIFRNFGDYAEERVSHFEKFGYKCLVISLPERSWREESKKNVLLTVSNFLMNGRRIKKVTPISDRQVARIGMNNRRGEGVPYSSLIEVYNIECENSHTYFVNGILSHNCDTTYAQESKPENWMSIKEILKKVPKGIKKVTLTGGEVLTQKEGLISLVEELLRKEKIISIETNGSIPIPFDNLLCEIGCFVRENKNVRWIVDYKLPSSGMGRYMKKEVFESLRDIDVIKFVISDKKDYKKACSLIKKHPEWFAKKVFSPCIGLNGCFEDKFGIVYWDLSWPRQLVEMMLRDRVPAQFSLQIHKILWPNAEGER